MAFAHATPLAPAPAPQTDLLPFERLAVKLSSCFSCLVGDDVDDSVACALAEVASAFGVDDCTLIAYDENGSATVVRSWAGTPHEPLCDDDIANLPWLVQRLARNGVVAITPTVPLPHAATSDRAHLMRTGVQARLAVPVVVGTHVAYGLIIGQRHRHGEWPAPLIDRLRLVGEILGGGLERVREHHAHAVRRPAGERSGEITSHDAAPAAPKVPGQPDDNPIIGESVPFRLALERLQQVAPLDATVLLLGETGTGKELFAQALHEASRRGRQRLIRVNCAALPATLIESELFGHERGAFTGAASMRQGRFELADGGTIFLDEIGDLAPELQAKLLRVLQEGEFERVGSSKTRQVDVRMVAATHVDLEKAVADGRFRADLYYRLSVFPITLPPLRDRPEDIPRLVWFFIHRRQRDLGRQITAVPDSVMHTLQQHTWPGNVRELENVIARAMIRSTDGTLRLDDASPVELRHAVEITTMSPPVTCGDTLDAVQRYHIERVLRQCGGRINGAGNAAVRLGLHPNTLRFRIKKLGVVLPERRGDAAHRPSAARP